MTRKRKASTVVHTYFFAETGCRNAVGHTRTHVLLLNNTLLSSPAQKEKRRRHTGTPPNTCLLAAKNTLKKKRQKKTARVFRNLGRRSSACLKIKSQQLNDRRPDRTFSVLPLCRVVRGVQASYSCLSTPATSRGCFFQARNDTGVKLLA